MSQVLIDSDRLQKLLDMERLGRPRNASDPRPKSNNQSVGTPRDLLDAIQVRYGKIVVDLAANFTNTVAPRFIGAPRKDELGGGCFALDSLSPRTDWPLTGPQEWLWLNPPYANISPWAEKCSQMAISGRKILMLVPASVGSCWFGQFVQGHAYVDFLNPRPKFIGYDQGAGKDHMLVIYCKLLEGRPSTTQWIWKNTRRNSR